jgi:prevent-host-death family protein
LVGTGREEPLIEAARRTPQTVTKHGKPAVVVVEYERLRHLERAQERPVSKTLSRAGLALPHNPLERVQIPADEETVSRLTFEQVDQESDKANWRDETLLSRQPPTRPIRYITITSRL